MGTSIWRMTGAVVGSAILSVGLFAQATNGARTAARASAPASVSAEALPVAAQQKVVQQFCVTCHNDAQKPGGLSLQAFQGVSRLAPNIAAMMVKKLQLGQMPPAGMPRPDAPTVKAFIAALQTAAYSASGPSWPTAPTTATFTPVVLSFPHNGNIMTVAAQNKMVHTICIQCHTDARKPGGISFEHFDMATAATTNAKTAEDMIAKLRAGMMPPASAPKRPDEVSIQAFVTSLERRIDRAAALHPNPGARLAQRLNRVEYADSIRSMLGLDIDVSQWLPPDTVSHNFDNFSAVQNFSPTLLQSYLEAANEISRLAVGDPQATATSVSFDTGTFRSQMHHVPGAPMGTRGGVVVSHIFPADGTYQFKILFYGTPVGDLYGLTALNEQLEVAVDGQRVALLKIDPKLSEMSPHGLTIETPPIEVHAGPRTIAATFLRQTDAPIDDLIAPQNYTLSDQFIGAAQGITSYPHLRTLTITGPMHVTGISDTVSRRKIFICRPLSAADETPCAKKIVSNLANQAYRRPATPAEVDALMKFYQEGRADGGNFESGIQTALQAMLVSTHFLFRLEPRPQAVSDGQNYPVSDYALASRLSYFLWGTPPDSALVKLAATHRLHDPAVLDAQVHRMLQDPRSFALSTRFAAHWLRLQDVDKVHPDALMYPMFNAQIADDMKTETEDFFHHIVAADRSVMELLTADYTYVNQELAAFYGIPGVAGPQFRQVSLVGTERRGILGQGAIQVETSVADRSDPVLRGKWVLEVLLGQPPPPPPPNVDTNLDDSSHAVEGGKPLSVRQRMEEHRANPFCASCHSVIDPIGLSLENFGPSGHWRIRDNEVPVDASTVLYDGTKMDGPEGLEQAMVKHQDTFLRVFTENLMAYALGRQINYYDMPTVRAIIHHAALNGNRFSSFVLGIVNSDAFRMSRAGALSAENSPSHESKKGF